MSASLHDTQSNKSHHFGVDYIESGGWRWQVVSEWRAVLTRDRAIPWLALHDYPEAEPLKRGELRNVWRVAVNGHRLVAKVYAPLHGLERIKSMLIGHPARREFEAAVYCRQQELNVIRPVAYGRLFASGSAGPFVLLTEEVPDAQPLMNYWLTRAGGYSNGSRGWENALAESLATWLAKLHAHQVLPADLHPGNILINESDQSPVPTLVDLHKLRYGKRVREIERLRNFSNMNQWFRRHASGVTRLRFLFDYLWTVYGVKSQRLIKLYAQDIMLLTDYDASVLESKRDRRILHDNKYFGIMPLPDRWQAHVYLQSKRPVAGSRCSTLQFSKQEWAPVLDDLVQGRLSPDGPGEIRIGPHRIPIQIRQNRQGGSDLQDLWERNHRRLNRHQPAAIPLALLERRSVGRTQESILVVEREEDHNDEARADSTAARRHHTVPG